jgi:hypothetical protein
MPRPPLAPSDSRRKKGSPPREDNLRNQTDDQENREDQLAEKKERTRSRISNKYEPPLSPKGPYSVDLRKHAPETHLESFTAAPSTWPEAGLSHIRA